MTLRQKRELFKPLLDENKRHKKITSEAVTGKVGDIGDEAINQQIVNGKYNRGSDCNGEDDENPVWSDDKKASFIVRVICGTAPLSFFLRQNDEEDCRETYDGANRILAISEFLSDKIRIRHAGTTWLFSELPDSAQKAFRNQKATTLTLHNCPEEFACRYAADLNNGTPMSLGEHLNLLRVMQTSRCVAFNRYVEQYAWSTNGDIGHRSGGVKLIALVMMHIEQKTQVWKEHQTAYIKKFFESDNPVTATTPTDAVLQAIDAMVQKWRADEFRISKKDLPKYLQILEAASILFSFHDKPLDQAMVNRLNELTTSIQKYSPSKLVAAYIS